MMTGVALRVGASSNSGTTTVLISLCALVTRRRMVRSDPSENLTGEGRLSKPSR
jgi:hypothetical protein